MHEALRRYRFPWALFMFGLAFVCEVQAQLYQNATVSFNGGEVRQVVLLHADDQGIYVDFDDTNWKTSTSRSRGSVFRLRVEDVLQIKYYGQPLPVVRGVLGGCLGWAIGAVIGPLAGAGVGFVVDHLRGGEDTEYTGILAVVGFFVGMVGGAVIGTVRSLEKDFPEEVFQPLDPAAIVALRARSIYPDGRPGFLDAVPTYTPVK